jgi:hypothetical protein
VSAQERREIGVDRGRLGAREQARLVRDLVRRRDVLEAQLARESPRARAPSRDGSRVDQRDRHRAVSRSRAPRERARVPPRSSGSTTAPSGADAAAHLDAPRSAAAGLADRELEQLGALLGADREQVAEARVGDEQRRHAAPLEQRVGGDGGAQLDAHARAVAGQPARSRISRTISCAGASSRREQLRDVQRAIGRTPIPS